MEKRRGRAGGREAKKKKKKKMNVTREKNHPSERVYFLPPNLHIAINYFRPIPPRRRQWEKSQNNNNNNNDNDDDI